MGSADLFRELVDYTYWGRDRILAAAARVTQEQLDMPTWLDHTSIQGTLVHQLGAEVMLTQRLERVQTIDYLEPQDVRDVASLRARWLTSEGRVRTLAAGLTDGDLAASITYTTRTGVEFTEGAYQVLFQLLNHATQHRSEVALALTQLGASPGFLDYAAYVRERAGQ